MNTPLSRARGRSRPYRQWRRAQGGGRTPFNVPRETLAPDPGPEAEFVYWYPGRFGVELASVGILTKLAAIHPTLSACRPPAKAPVPRSRWLIWARDPKAQNIFCPGWYLVFVWEVTKTKKALPLEPFDHLEECICAVMVTKTTGGAKAYFERLRDTRAASKAAREAAYQDQRQTKQRDLLVSRRISNISRGSQFALHHDGTIVPSRGELNWLRERQERAMPAEIRQRLSREREQLRQAGWIP